MGDVLADAIARVVRETLLVELPRVIDDLRHAQPEPPRLRRVITVPAACRLYGIGRRALIDLIARGHLPATTRRQRGGRDGYMLRVADCDRVLGAGRGPTTEGDAA